MKLDDDDFTLFDLPRRHALQRSDLDGRWRALQSQVHPDRFAAQGDAAQRVAMQWAVRVNEAYQRLKDPLRRAAYLCELAGVPIAAENNTAMPATFLMQQMQWREALDDAPDLEAVRALERELGLAEQGLMTELATSLDDRDDAATAAGQVRALMFVHRFRQDVERRIDAYEL